MWHPIIKGEGKTEIQSNPAWRKAGFNRNVGSKSSGASAHEKAFHEERDSNEPGFLLTASSVPDEKVWCKNKSESSNDRRHSDWPSGAGDSGAPGPHREDTSKGEDMQQHRFPCRKKIWQEVSTDSATRLRVGKRTHLLPAETSWALWFSCHIINSQSASSRGLWWQHRMKLFTLKRDGSCGSRQLVGQSGSSTPAASPLSPGDNRSFQNMHDSKELVQPLCWNLLGLFQSMLLTAGTGGHLVRWQLQKQFTAKTHFRHFSAKL